MRTKKKHHRSKKRTRVIKVRAYTEEEAHMKKVAAARGRAVAVLLRELGMGLAPPERRSAGADHLVRELARLGVLLSSAEAGLDRGDHSSMQAAYTCVAEARAIANELIGGL